MAIPVFANAGVEVVVVDVNGTNRILTTDYIGGFPELSNDMVEVTAASDIAHRNIGGLQDANIRLSFNLNDTATTGSWAVLSGLLGGTSSVRNVISYPAGTASGKPIITLPTRLQSVSINGNSGDKVTLDASFVIDGTRTVGTV